MSATHESHSEKVAAYVAGVLFPIAVYVAFWLVHGWNVTARVGFCVIVPSLVGSIVAAVIKPRSDRRGAAGTQ